MANTDQPNGLAPFTPNGVPPKVTRYLAGTTTNISRGDVVAINSSGNIHRIATTTGSARVIGVAQNSVIVTQGTAGTTSANVWVYDDPDQEFIVQDDGAAATPAATDVGATFALIVAAGNTTTGQSIMEVDASASGNASTDPVILKGFLQGGAYAIGKNSKMIVVLNRHHYRKASTGI